MDNSKNTESKVVKVLHSMGMRETSKGYQYVLKAIILSIENPELVDSITKRLYPAIAEGFGTTPSAVECAIRRTISDTWKNGDCDVLGLYFGYFNMYKPTNAEFICMIADHLKNSKN